MSAVQNKVKYRNHFLESPTPSFGDILRLLCHNNSLNTLGQPWSAQEKDIYFFSRGTWAIAAFVQWFLNVTGRKEANIFLPDYFCNPTLRPLRQQKIKLNFYPICQDLSPDWDAVENETEHFGPPDIFILVHYFGFPCGAEKAHSYCQSVGAILLEDCAHALLPTPMMGQKADVAIYSLHKVLGVPDGGLLVVDKNLLTRLSKSNKKNLFDALYLASNKDSISLASQFFWVFKKIVQRFCFNRGIGWNRMAALEHNFTGEGTIKNIYGMSATGKWLMTVYQQRIKLFEQLRRQNYLTLNKIVLEMKPIIQPLFRELPAHSIPYIYPMLIEPEYIEQLYSALNTSKIPASPWPDLPPEVKDSPQNHKTAVKIRQSIITLPIHQSLSLKHITRIGRTLQSQVSKLTNR